MRPRRTVDLYAIAEDAMVRYGFEPAFPAPVMKEMARLPQEAPVSSRAGLADLRGLLWSSIDNYDSMDLDQLEYCEVGKTGEILVRVAIADVDLYVPKGSKTDRYAARNGSSIYTGVRTFPMLPDQLSKGISSLLPEGDRVAVVIEYTVLPDGKVLPRAISRALVRNKAKLVYEEVGAWLDGSGPIPATVRDTPGLEEQVRMQADTSVRMKRYRIMNGALDLETIEADVRMDRGQVIDLVLQEQNPARGIIEDFMVAANRTMMSFLGHHGLPSIERVVRKPKYWGAIVLLAGKYGTKLPAEPDAEALTRFLIEQRERDPLRFPDLSLTVVKLLGHGEYVVLEPKGRPLGHFALAVTDYTHSTAPNRRYADLLIQRLVQSALDKESAPYTTNELDSQAAWLTDREIACKKVERFVRKAAAAVLLQDRIGEAFDALVTGAAEKGTYVRLLSPPAEGRVIRGEQGLRVGQQVKVRLLDTDPYNGFIDFACLGGKGHGR